MNAKIIEEDLTHITGSGLPWESLEGESILITGAGGMLPSYLVETILHLNDRQFRKKAKIFALVRDVEKAKNRFKNYAGRSDLVFVSHDIRDPLRISDPIDYLIHAASNASPKHYGNDPAGTLIPNSIGTYNCLEFARNQDLKSFLFFSSGEVYGDGENINGPVHEKMFGKIDPMVLRSCYSESKRMGETMCVAYFSQYGIPAKIVRPFHTYGPSMRLDDGRVFADFVSDIVHNRDIVLYSDGSAKRTFCYISDATIAFFLVLLKGQPDEAYNVGGDEPFELSIAELANLLVGLFPEKKLKVIKKENSFGNGYIKSGINRLIPDISKIRELGWTPRISVRDGFKRTVRSFL
jgi:UDP-glucuronate decarboxylase